MKWFSALAGGLVLLVALMLVGPVGVDAKQGGAKAHTVEIGDDFYKPKEITISVGDSIIWVNKGKKTHTATSDDAGKTFDTKNVKKGAKSESVKFKKRGKVPYHCEHHEDQKGTIIVK